MSDSTGTCDLCRQAQEPCCCSYFAGGYLGELRQIKWQISYCGQLQVEVETRQQVVDYIRKRVQIDPRCSR